MVQVQYQKPQITLRKLEQTLQETRELRRTKSMAHAVAAALKGNRIRPEIAGNVEQYIRKAIANTDTSEVLKELGL